MESDGKKEVIEKDVSYELVCINEVLKISFFGLEYDWKCPRNAYG